MRKRHLCSNMREHVRRLESDDKTAPLPKSTYVEPVDIASWEEAEVQFPGCTEEWKLMCEPPYGDFCPRGNPDVRLSSWAWEPGRIILLVTQKDPEGAWASPPEWRRWRAGEWTHPMPMKKMLLFYEEYSTGYKYKL